LSADYGRLCFSTVEFAALEQGVSPRFQCPVCKHSWQPKLALGTNFGATFDFNQRVSFAIPTHDNEGTGARCDASGKRIELFVAVHKDEEYMQLCIQRSDAEGAGGITTNWWRPTT
jgi:hypothetical protein